MARRSSGPPSSSSLGLGILYTSRSDGPLDGRLENRDERADRMDSSMSSSDAAVRRKRRDPPPPHTPPPPPPTMRCFKYLTCLVAANGFHE